MPNNITNKIEFHGDQDNINQILKLIRGARDCIDFNKIIPMPESLMLPSGGDQDAAIQYALSKMSHSEHIRIKDVFVKTPSSFYGNYYNKIFACHPFGVPEAKVKEMMSLFEQKLKDRVKDVFDSTDYEGLGIKNFEDLGNAYINNIINYGHVDWYDWSIANWGSKWNAYSSYLDEENNAIEFDTAWGCPFPVLDKLAKLCYEHNVWFTGKWADEDIGHNVGVFESSCDGDEYWFTYDYVENNSNEAFDIYTELKGESDCLSKDADGTWIRHGCENCPNPC